MGAHPHSQLPPDDTAQAASDVIELLEVLWERGRDTVPTAPVSPSQLRVLYSLDREEGMNLRRLGELLDSAPSSVSRLCDRLQAMGLLERTPSPVSRRELELHLTRKAKRYLVDLRARREEALLTVLDRMPARARKDLTKGLQALRFAAQEQDAVLMAPGAEDTRSSDSRSA
ncbi:MarR family winged helix-turn-helix transcriptional regulator [Streptomyces sp. TR06-5]|uniref:MarR family winged helix-turn-helix transcriptional regulator n=1 Tax=unclassified Streptomyces TaxID=2593676 RepID=UPI0039A2FE32